jgi:hypothetical protein
MARNRRLKNPFSVPFVLPRRGTLTAVLGRFLFCLVLQGGHDGGTIQTEVRTEVGVRFGDAGLERVHSVRQTRKTLLEYNGTTGAFVKTFASGGGLSDPDGLVFGPNGDLFVSGFLNNAVLEYNGTTGAFVKTFASGGGLSEPTYLTFGPSVSAVPEPPGLLLAALGALAGLASAARRRAADFFRPANP